MRAWRALRRRIFAAIQTEKQRTVSALRLLTAETGRLAKHPALARLTRSHNPTLPLQQLQVELLRCWHRAPGDEHVKLGIHMTINGIAAALRNTG